MKNKTPKSQIKASRAWEQRNKDKTRINSYKRTAKLFIRNHASLEELDDLQELIDNKRK